MTAELQVFIEGAGEFVYRGASILARTAPRSLRQLADDGLAVEAATVAVGLLSPTLLGATSKADLPPGEHRARLVIEHFAEDGDGHTAVIEGTVMGREVSHGRAFPGESGDAQLRRWTVTLRDDANEQAWERLDDVDALTAGGDLLLSGDGLLELDVRLVYTEGEGGARNVVDTLYAYDLAALLEAVLARADNLEAESGAPLFARPEFPVAWVDGGGVVRAHVHRPQLAVTSTTFHGRGHAPEWTGAELIEAVCAERGLRLEARYAPYPSRTVLLRLVPTSGGVVPDDAPRFDDLADDWDWSTEPTRETDLAVRYAPAEIPSEDERPVLADDVDDDTAWTIWRPAPPTTTYAAGRWALGRPDGLEPGEPENEGVIEVPFAQLHGDIVAEVVAAYDSGYEERQTFVRPVIQAGTGPFLLSVAPIPGTGALATLVRREPVSPDPGLPYSGTHELWADALYRRLAGTLGLTADRDVIEVEVQASPDVAASLLVGDAAGGFRLDDHRWVPERLEFDHARQRITLGGARASSAAPVLDAPPFASPRVTAEVVYFDGTGYYLFIYVQTPPRCPADRYDIEVLVSGAWHDIETLPSRSRSLDWGHRRAVHLRPAGFPHPGPQTVRARARYELGFVSDWVEATTED